MENSAGIAFKILSTVYFTFPCKVYVGPLLNTIILSQIVVWQIPFCVRLQLRQNFSVTSDPSMLVPSMWLKDALSLATIAPGALSKLIIGTSGVIVSHFP